eukprot:445549_1
MVRMHCWICVFTFILIQAAQSTIESISTMWDIQWKVALPSESEPSLSIHNLKYSIWEVCDYPLTSIHIHVTEMLQNDDQLYFITSIHIANITYSDASNCLLNGESMNHIRKYFDARSDEHSEITIVSHDDTTKHHHHFIGFITVTVIAVVLTFIFCVICWMVIKKRRATSPTQESTEYIDSQETVLLTEAALKQWNQTQYYQRCLNRTMDDSTETDDTLTIIEALGRYD